MTGYFVKNNYIEIKMESSKIMRKDSIKISIKWGLKSEGMAGSWEYNLRATVNKIYTWYQNGWLGKFD